jgi:hypothetical protein
MEQILKDLAAYLQEKLKDELISQDHVAKGNLLRSIDVYVEQTVAAWKIKGGMLDYGITQDTGAPPRTVVSVATLLEWFRDKKINPTSPLFAAINLKRRIYEKGTPVDGNPDKKRWISGTLEVEADEIKTRVQAAVVSEMSLIVSNMIEKTNKKLM